jgi:hypothetical protein
VTRRRWERLLWAAALLLAAAGWVRWRRALPTSPPPAPAALAPPPAVRPRDPARLAAAGGAVARGNPFRLDRVPAPVRAAGPLGLGSAVGPGYGPYVPPAGYGAPPAYTPPPFAGAAVRVTGISGPPWEAVLEGVPGRPGAVVAREGDQFGDLRVRSISSDRVVVQGRDSIQRLQIQRTRP